MQDIHIFEINKFSILGRFGLEYSKNNYNIYSNNSYSRNVFSLNIRPVFQYKLLDYISLYTSIGAINFSHYWYSNNFSSFSNFSIGLSTNLSLGFYILIGSSRMTNNNDYSRNTEDDWKILIHYFYKDKEINMLNRNISIGIQLTLLVFGSVLIGCASSPNERSSRSNERVSWSEYIPVPAKDYTVVEVVILREVDPATLSTNLMEKAVEMGAHDIINVRVDDERRLDENGRMRRRVVAASALAIKYTDRTLTDEFLHMSYFYKTE